VFDKPQTCGCHALAAGMLQQLQFHCPDLVRKLLVQRRFDRPIHHRVEAAFQGAAIGQGCDEVDQPAAAARQSLGDTGQGGLAGRNARRAAGDHFVQQPGDISGVASRADNGRQFARQLHFSGVVGGREHGLLLQDRHQQRRHVLGQGGRDGSAGPFILDIGQGHARKWLDRAGRFDPAGGQRHAKTHAWVRVARQCQDRVSQRAVLGNSRFGQCDCLLANASIPIAKRF
jgi:hypothetical protein